MSALSDIGDFLSRVAPTAAGLLGGPLAAQGVSLVEGWLGVAPKSGDTIEARAAAVQAALVGATPDQLIAMRRADNELKAKFVDAGLQIALADNADRASARSLTAATKSNTPTVLTYLIAAAAAGISSIIVSGLAPKDPNIATTIGTIVGYIFSELKAVTSFWFGSSSGSSDKNSLLDKALDKGATP
jgi:hypothetical protein